METRLQSAGESLHEPAPSAPTPKADAPIAQAPIGKQPQRRPLWMWIAGGVLVLLALYEAIPWAITAFRTESTDDAYVNGHVTFVAPRVPGQVVRVLVDDNNRVRKGDSARAARQGAVPGQGRYRASRARRLRRPTLSQHRRKFGALRVWRAANGSIWQMRCRTSTTRSPTCTPKWTLFKPRMPPSSRPGPTSGASSSCTSSRLYQNRSSIRSRKPFR